MQTLKTATRLTKLETALLKELTCRAAGDRVWVAVLVECYGPQAKDALAGLERAGLVLLEAWRGPVSQAARELEMSEEEYLAGCIRQLDGRLLSRVVRV